MKINLFYEVCIVDDDEMYLHALKHNLEGSDGMIKVQTFNTGEGCLEYIFKSTPDAIVLDYYLDETGRNDMTGMNMLMKIKEIKEQVPVIMLSGQKDLEVAVSCMKMGACDYIIKNQESIMRLRQGVGNMISAKERQKKMKVYEAWNVITAGALVVFLTSMVIYAYQHG
jgi:DNA-binding NtrC family response regulator